LYSSTAPLHYNIIKIITNSQLLTQEYIDKYWHIKYNIVTGIYTYAIGNLKGFFMNFRHYISKELLDFIVMLKKLKIKQKKELIRQIKSLQYKDGKINNDNVK